MSNGKSPPSPLKSAASQGGTPKPAPKKNKVVTFKEIEIEEEKQDEPQRSLPLPRPKPNEKNKNLKIDISNLNEGMDKLGDKLKRKFSGKTPDAGTSSSNTDSIRALPWEVDLSKLNIGKAIGKGSYGLVYRGTYHGQSVAIKMLDWGTNDLNDSWSVSFQSKFLKEVQVMHSLGTHPNVCKLLGATLGSQDFTIPSPIHGSRMVPVSKMMCCIIMEYVSGGSLREFWVAHRRSGKRRMNFGVTVQFAIDIARGLAYLHSKKVLHRDLKPDNILLGEDSVAKIADFGISRFLPDPNSSDDNLSLYKGTPNYCAPEILDGKDYTHKADVYSYGISLWEIYTCDVPNPDIVNIDHGRVNQAIVKGVRPKIPLSCPLELKYIMTRCWDKRPERRPEMTEVLKLLERIDTDKCRCLTSDSAAECTACIVEVGCRSRP